MLGIEEAGRSPDGQRLVVEPGQHAGGCVAAVLEGLGHATNVVGLAHGVQGRLRGVVGVQRPAIVLPGPLVELAARDIDVECLQVLP